MGWKLGGVCIKKDFSGQELRLLRMLGMENWVYQGEISIRKASRFDFMQTAIGVYNDCTLLINHFLPYDLSFEPDTLYEPDRHLMALSLEADVLAFLMDGTSGTYFFSCYRAGRRIRLRHTQPGEVLADTGTPFAIEANFDPQKSQDENRIFRLLEMFVGVAPEIWLMDETFCLNVYAPAEEQESGI
ncbi:MAG: hypothetical protein D6730_10395 [Bacteroidetes bacterium]|nr:MAG: hypothetical protein D6730_10395 [Bacteroidota bacterium]